MKVLQLTVHLLPNVGGVETHLKDLFNSLIKRDWDVFVLAYQPLSTKTNWKIFEKNKNLTILRIPWIRGFFEKLVYHPSLEFIYLVPGLFIITPLVLLSYRPDVLHAHGLIAAVSAAFWGKLFKIRVVVSLHSLYNFPNRGLYRNFVKFILNNSDFVLSLSKKSNQEVKLLGMESKKAGIFTYWIDLNKFVKKENAREKFTWRENFIVLFVGRLISEKGIDVLLDSLKSWDKNVGLVMVGTGPKEKEIITASLKDSRIHFLGKVNQDNLADVYSAADIVIVPSTSDEGFGRVIMEALACSTPVIGSNRGAIPEAMDETVGSLIDIDPRNIKGAVEYFYKNPLKLKSLAKNCRNFVERRYSEKNAEQIISSYTN